MARRELGYPCRLSTGPLRADALNIVFGVNQFADYGAIKLPDNTVIVNLEQYYPESPWFTPSILDLMRKHSVSDYNPANVAALRALGVARVRLVPIGSAPGMRRIRPVSPDIAQGVCLAAYEDLPQAMHGLCIDAVARAAVAEKGRAIMAARPQRAYLAEALRARVPA